MSNRRYYSGRAGTNPQGVRYDLPMLRRLFVATFTDFAQRERFQEMLGKDCPDDPDAYGTAGHAVAAYVLLKTRKDGLWPIHHYSGTFSEDDVFDLMEFLFDHVSVGTGGWHHSYNSCGDHFSEFDRSAGQAEWRGAINQYLCDYADGFELSQAGEVLRLGPQALHPIFSATLPAADPNGVMARVDAAIAKFRRHSSTLEDRRDAVRDLADVLEFLRPAAKLVLDSADESDLFNLANNFGVRHHNQKQKTKYDRDIWLNGCSTSISQRFMQCSAFW